MNPWQDLLRPIRSRPGDPLPKVSSVPSTQSKSITPVAAAALVVTDSGVFDMPYIRLVPIIVYDFGL
jgi:hypothetical protein